MKKTPLIIGGIVLALILMIIVKGVTAQNGAINLEEQVLASSSDINVQEKRRVDLLVNLVDAIQDSKQFELETMTSIVEARTQATTGNIEEAKAVINAVAEAYPELKTSELYKNYTLELANTENMISKYRETYNTEIRSYKKFVRVFPNSLFLNVIGYEVQDFEYLEYEDATVNAPTNLFGNGN